MLKKKISSEIRENVGNIRVKVGTMDKKNPSIIYSDLNTFLRPNEEIQGYEDRMGEIGNVILKRITAMVRGNDNISDRFVYVFDYPQEKMRPGKKSQITAHLHFKINSGSGYSQMQFVEMAKKYINDTADVYNDIDSLVSERGFTLSA